MRPRTVALAVSLVGPLLGGCTTDPPLAPEQAPAIAANFSNGPGAPGPMVVRFRDGQFAFLNIDFSTGLASVIGLPADPAASPDPFCGGSGAYDVLDWQLVIHPTGPINVLLQAGAVYVHLYDATPYAAKFEAGDVCGAVSLPRIAEGTATLRYTDNDFNVSGTRADAYGWTVTGTLTLAGGGTARYLDVLRAQIRPNGTADLRSAVRLAAAR